jgi:hypothetical protein
MKNIQHSILLLTSLVFLLSSCEKRTQIIHQKIVDNIIYEVGGEVIYQDNSEKNKQKSNTQYISILYANLFQTPISTSNLTNLSEVRTAVGDKQLIDELIINDYLNDPNVQIPTNQEMRNDIDQFVENTYVRFFLRLPDAYERYFLKNAIENDPELTPELIYSAFATSNEYKFY